MDSSLAQRLPLSAALVVTAVAVVLSVVVSPWWLLLTVIGAVLVVGVVDLRQSQHALRRNFPILARARWAAEGIRPEIRQYFVESDTDGRPFNRNDRSIVYERAKNAHSEYPCGTELDIAAAGYEWFVHSIAANDGATEPFTVPVGGPQCTQPYEMALLNVSAMSFGALSGKAITALNRGAARGGFAHDTGEGGLSPCHRNGGDLVWEIGTAYFGCRTDDGDLDPAAFTRQARYPEVKTISIKLSQGAKPGWAG